jgi:hypothetical protein
MVNLNLLFLLAIAFVQQLQIQLRQREQPQLDRLHSKAMLVVVKTVLVIVI